MIELIHGDCLENLYWLDHCQFLLTDPPYGIGFRSGMGGAFGDSRVIGDDSTAVRDAVLDVWGDRPALVFGSWKQSPPAGTRAVLTWNKGLHVGMGDLKGCAWKPNTEEIYVVGRWEYPGKRESSVLTGHYAIAGTVGQRGKGTRWHPTEKPVSLIKQLLAKVPPEWTIVDPFCGSGTTLLAAHEMGRSAIGIEIDAEYYEAALRRLTAAGVWDGGPSVRSEVVAA